MFISKERSQILKISYGVPQGYILGPLLFILYINDFASISEKLFYILLADNTNIFLNGKYINKLVEIIQSELFKLCNWLQMNILPLNLPKNYFMVFHRATHKLNIRYIHGLGQTTSSSTQTRQNALFIPDPAEYSTQLELQIDNITLPMNINPKILGLSLDPKLTYNKHIDITTNT